jgi:hypothetical protein
MSFSFNFGAATVTVVGSSGAFQKIRTTLQYSENLQPLFAELDAVKEILPVAGAAGAAMTVRQMADEIKALRKQIQKMQVVKPGKPEKEDD